MFVWAGQGESSHSGKARERLKKITEIVLLPQFNMQLNTAVSTQN